MKNLKVLVLGHNGMLGHMVLKYLKYKKIKCIIINHRFYPIIKAVKDSDCNFIINCIGAIPQKTNEFDINFSLPIALDSLGIKIIHPGTDCESDDTEYGRSKKKASDWIKNYGKNTKIIKASIIGPELSEKKYGLMDWFLSQEKEVKGYSEFYWNGVTTLLWARYSCKMMEDWIAQKKETILGSNCISKYDLLKIIRYSWGKEIDVVPVSDPKENKCLTLDVGPVAISYQMFDLIKFQQRRVI